jgi:concanavalin A-like lectin/glucanase superfamily protein
MSRWFNRAVVSLVLLLVLCCAGNVFSATQALWLFEEGDGLYAYDASGNNNTATLDSDTHTPLWSTGKYGGGLSVIAEDGVDFILVQDSDSLDVTSGLTIESWINFHGKISNGDIVDKWLSNDTGTWRSYAFSVWGASGGRPRLVARIQKADNSGQINWTSHDDVLPPLGWQHVAFTYDGASGAGKLYLNGSEIPTVKDGGSYSGDIHVDTAPLSIAGFSSMGFFDSNLDELRISDVALPSGSGSGVGELAWNTSLNPDGGMFLPLANGWTLFASGEKLPLLWSDCKIKKDGSLYSISSASGSGWIEGSIYYFDGATQTYKVTPTDDNSLQTDNGYWIWSNLNGLELFVPYTQ